MKLLNISYSYIRSTDPHINLAIENNILENLGPNSMHILFWVNRPCIVMGRFQNPYLECNIDQMLKDDISIVRRQSGGGCVYHDLGNLNYSFITNKEHHNKDNNHSILIAALESLGVSAYSTKRVDLFTSHDGLEKKFSGSAFKEKRTTAFHHGTLLVNSNLDELNHYLTPRDLSVKSVSIDSVRSKVVNLSQINPNITIEAIVESVVAQVSKFYDVDVSEVLDLRPDIVHLKKITSKKWYFAETPKFKIFDIVNGVGELEVEIKKMKILNLSVDNNEIHESFLVELYNTLQSVSLLESDYLDLINSLGAKYEMYSEFTLKLIEWFEDRFSVLRK